VFINTESVNLFYSLYMFQYLNAVFHLQEFITHCTLQNELTQTAS